MILAKAEYIQIIVYHAYHFIRFSAVCVCEWLVGYVLPVLYGLAAEYGCFVAPSPESPCVCMVAEAPSHSGDVLMFICWLAGDVMGIWPVFMNIIIKSMHAYCAYMCRQVAISAFQLCCNI